MVMGEELGRRPMGLERDLETLIEFLTHPVPPPWVRHLDEKLNRLEALQRWSLHKIGEQIMGLVTIDQDELNSFATQLETQVTAVTTAAATVTDAAGVLAGYITQLLANQATPIPAADETAISQAFSDISSAASSLGTAVGGVVALEPPVVVPPPPPVLPVVSAVAPAEGSDLGGDTVVLTGSGFTGALTVFFGSAPAASFTVDSDTQVTAVSPAGSDGSVDVTVTTSAGVSAAGSSFVYSGPTVVTPPATTTPVPVDANALPVQAGTLDPSTNVVEVPQGVVPVVVADGSVAITAGSLPADAFVTPVQ
jgi:hypothetical protein